MKKQNKKLSFIILIAAMLMLAMAVPAFAKTSTAWKKAYKDYLAKGKISYPVITVKTNSKGKVTSKKTRTETVKIDKFALVNIDGKGAPELLLLKQNGVGEAPTYWGYVAGMNGNKVQLATSSYPGSKVKLYGITGKYTEIDNQLVFIFDEIRVDSKNKVLIVDWGDYYFVKYSNGKLTGIGCKSYDEPDDEDYDEEIVPSYYDVKGKVPSYMKSFDPEKSKTIKLYSNTKSNRNKLAKGKIKAAK